MILTALGVVALLRARRSVHDRHARPVLAVTAFFISAMVMAILALGPYLIWMGKVTKFPLPYQLVYYFVPGGKAMRCAGRFTNPLILCVSMVGAFGWAFSARFSHVAGKRSHIFFCQVWSFCSVTI